MSGLIVCARASRQYIHGSTGAEKPLMNTRASNLLSRGPNPSSFTYARLGDVRHAFSQFYVAAS